MKHHVSAEKNSVDAGSDGLVRAGLIGKGIQLSRTPRMHINEGIRQGLSYSYELLDIEHTSPETNLADMLDQCEAKGFSGLNITYPFKQKVIHHIDILSDAAKAVNAVNTIVFRQGKRFGHNTDYWGFSEAFRISLFDVRLDHVLLLGAGGAGGALANALIDLGVKKLTIFDKDRDAASFLANSMNTRISKRTVFTASTLDEDILNVDGIVNATPVGMASMPGSAVPLAFLDARHWVADIIYFPLETELLAAARAKGCQTMDGSGMAVFQAVRAFELFSGVKPDPKKMRATFDAFTNEVAGQAGI
jgi:shikimate dehydrogenase